MAKYLVANENGDWWELDTDTDTGSALWVIEADKLREQLREQQEQGAADFTDLYEIHKLEREIREYGEMTTIEGGN